MRFYPEQLPGNEESCRVEEVEDQGEEPKGGPSHDEPTLNTELLLLMIPRRNEPTTRKRVR